MTNNQWKDVIEDELICCHIGTTDSFPDAKAALKNLIDWYVSVALDPAVSSDARALLDKGKSAAPVLVPLTDEQIDALYINGTKHWIGKRQIARAIEAAHGIAASPEVP